MNDRCFVYKWFNKVTLMWYIGSHYSKTALQDWIKQEKLDGN